MKLGWTYFHGEELARAKLLLEAERGVCVCLCVSAYMHMHTCKRQAERD